MKKGLVLLVAVFMLLTSAANVSAASFEDTAGKNCETAVEVLSALGIVEGKQEGSYEPDAALTRAEMTTIVLRTMDMADGAVGRDVFTDVPSSHWAYAYVAAAYQLGIVKGTSETTFAPDLSVTYEQAVKMVVASLGYTVQAEALGGYPAGYLAKAAQLGLLKGVKSGGEISRGDMAILVYNALDTPLLMQSTYGTEAYSFDTDKNASLLSYYKKIDHYDSMVTATPMAEIYAPSRSLLDDEVAIEKNDLIFKKGTTNAQDLLGVRADFYVKEPDYSDIADILAVVPRASANVIDISAKDVESSSTASQLVYTDENDKEHKIGISGATLIYNGRVKYGWTAQDLMPDIGTVRLVANSGSDYNLIIVQSFKNYVVDSVVMNSEDIYFMEAVDGVSSINASLTDKKRPTVFTDELNEPITVEDVARWDILSVAESEDHSIRRMYRSFNMAVGTVTELSGDEAVIDGKTYPIAQSLKDSERFNISIGQSGGFYLDFTGAIAAVDEGYERNASYGWLNGAKLSKGLSPRAQFKIYTSDGDFKVFDAKEKILLNGYSTDSAKLLAAGEYNVLWENGSYIPQLLRYKTNDAGVLTEIDTAVNLTSLPDDEKIGGSFSMDYYYNNSRYRAEFNGTAAGARRLSNVTTEDISGIFFSRVRTDGKTPVFIIPKDMSNEKDYQIRAASSYNMEEIRNTGCMAFYDVDENYYCPVMVYHNYLTSSAAGAVYPAAEDGTWGLVTAVSKSVSDDGDPYTQYKLYNTSGQVISALVDDDLELLYKAANADVENDPYWYTSKSDDGTKLRSPIGSSSRPEMFLAPEDLQSGDIIQYKLGSSGKLSMCAVLYRANYPGNMEISNNQGKINLTGDDRNYQGGVLTADGFVTKVTNAGPMMTVNLVNSNGTPSGQTALRAIINTGRMVTWDRNKETYRTTAFSEIAKGDEVVTIWRTNVQYLLVVYH